MDGWSSEGFKTFVQKEIPGSFGIAKSGDDGIAFVRIPIQRVESTVLPDHAGAADLIEPELHEFPDDAMLVAPHLDMQVRSHLHPRVGRPLDKV